MSAGSTTTSLAPTILFGVLEQSAFVLGIGLLCSVFDLAYIALVWRESKKPATLVVGARAA